MRSAVSLTQRGVKVIMHNTLASSDGLLDPDTFEPRPNYWATLLWHKLMGTTVLNPKMSPPPNSYAYAQCLPGRPGGVALLLINADRQREFAVTIPEAAERYTLTTTQLEDTTVQLNGNTLRVNSNGDLPQLKGEPTQAGRVGVAPGTITFLAFATAQNKACEKGE
jgi:heparanase